MKDDNAVGAISVAVLIVIAFVALIVLTGCGEATPPPTTELDALIRIGSKLDAIGWLVIFLLALKVIK